MRRVECFIRVKNVLDNERKIINMFGSSTNWFSGVREKVCVYELQKTACDTEFRFFRQSYFDQTVFMCLCSIQGLTEVTRARFRDTVISCWFYSDKTDATWISLQVQNLVNALFQKFVCPYVFWCFWCGKRKWRRVKLSGEKRRSQILKLKFEVKIWSQKLE